MAYFPIPGAFLEYTGAGDFLVPWGDALTVQISGEAPPVATELFLTPPSPAEGTVLAQSGLWTITADGTVPDGTVITPDSDDAGDTFDPATVVWPANTFRMTPDSTAGARDVTITNDGGLANPASVVYTANAAPEPGAGGGGLFGQGGLFS